MDKTYCLRQKKYTDDLEPEIIKDSKCRLRKVSICAECGANKSKFIKATKSGKGYNDGKTKYGMGCMQCDDDEYYGGSLNGGIMSINQKQDHINDWYIHKQDLNEYQDEMTNRRIQYMMNLYRQNHQDDFTGDDAVENENIDQADEFGNVVDNAIPNYQADYEDMGDTEKQIYEEDLETEMFPETEEYETETETEGKGFYHKKILPLQLNRLIDEDYNKWQEDYIKKVNKSAYQPEKKRYDNVEYQDILLTEGRRGNELIPDDRKKGIDLKSKVYNPYEVWAERNGYTNNKPEVDRYILTERLRINKDKWI